MRITFTGKMAEAEKEIKVLKKKEKRNTFTQNTLHVYIHYESKRYDQNINFLYLGEPALCVNKSVPSCNNIQCQ